MKANGEGGIRILNLGTRLKWVVKFTPPPINPGGENPCTRWRGGCVDPGAGLNAVEKRKFSSLYHESNHDSSVILPIAYHYIN
jgi:hypothetical protein